MNCLPLFFLILSMNCHPPVDVIKEYIAAPDSSCLSIRVIDQPFFPDVCFYDLDTQCYYSMPPEKPPASLRLGIDSLGNVFRVFGFDESDYEQLVTDHPVRLTVETVYDYGRWYLDLTFIDEFEPYYFVTDLDSLLELNRRLLLDAPRNWSTRERERHWREVEKSLRSVCDTLNLKYTIFDREESVYRLDYYVWYEDDGRLEHIDLALRESGHCQIDGWTTLAEHVGYYRWLKY